MFCAFQVETLIRELDGVLYQALHLATHGLPTMLGDRMANTYINRSSSPLIYFDSDQQEVTNRHVLNNGGVVINLNSEGQGFVDQPAKAQENFARVADYATLICMWGDRQKEQLARLIPAEMLESVVVTGHPSFDLVHPDFVPYFKRKDITEKHGEDYTLINTSFAVFNHEMGLAYYLKMLGKMDEWKMFSKAEYQAYLNKRAEIQGRIAQAMVDLAKEIARRFPERHVIIRPHPGEGTQYYEDGVGNVPNIFISKKYSAREWIASARAVIHHDCTTGMEATLMGKPVLQFEPYEGIDLSAKFMTQIGKRVTNPAEVIEDLGSEVHTDREKLLEPLRPYLKNIDANAASRIAQIASAYAKDMSGELPQPVGTWESVKCWRKYLSKLLRARQPGRNGRKVRYALNKFARLRKVEIEEKLTKLRAIDPKLPEVTVEQLCLNTFIIKPA